MSDDLRIYGRGAGGGAYQDERRENLARFRRAHKPGEIVRGVFVRLEHAAPGTAWVNFEGSSLLAGLPPDLAEAALLIAKGQGAGAMPTGVREADFPLKNGDVCYFALESLEPEPVLRMLGLHEKNGQKNDDALAQALLLEQQAIQRRSLLKLPLTQLAARYSQKRNALDAALRERLWQGEDLSVPFPAALPETILDFGGASVSENAGYPPDSADSPAETTSNEENATTQDAALPTGRGEYWRAAQKRYAAFVRKDGEAQKTHDEMNLYRLALIEQLRPHGLMGFFFVPWLCPAASGLELAFYSQSPVSAARGLDAGPGAAPNEAVAGIKYVLQGSIPTGGAGQAVNMATLELSGSAGYERVLRRELKNTDPDLMRLLLALKPQTIHPGFSRMA